MEGASSFASLGDPAARRFRAASRYKIAPIAPQNSTSSIVVSDACSMRSRNESRRRTLMSPASLYGDQRSHEQQRDDGGDAAARSAACAA